MTSFLLRQCYSFSRMKQHAPLAFVRRVTSKRLVPISSSVYPRNCLLHFHSLRCHGRQRGFSSNAATTMNDDTMMENATATVPVPSKEETQRQEKQQVDDLIRPEDLGSIPYPKALSPSAIMEFKKCPQSFLFQYLYGLKQPTSEALAKGSMCHSALEKLFDLDPEDRTLQVLQDLFRAEWSQNRLSDTYRILFEKTADTDTTSNDGTSSLEWDLQAERQWGKAGLKLLENYYKLEDPRKIVRPNPMKREIWLNSHLSIDPELGATAPRSNNSDSVDHQKYPFNATEENMMDDDDDDDIPTFHVRGIVDRLDMIRTRDSLSQASLRIVDYKTGKAPNLKYSQAMNKQIIDEAFFQLKIYALLLREKGAEREIKSDNAMNVRLLRLLYLTSESGEAVNWDLDMGATPEERDALLQDVHQELSKVWQDIVELVSAQDPKAFIACDRTFCYCHKCRTRFVPGTLWEPEY